jgi:hypothetical protein
MAVENDIVLIHLEGKPLSFARIESIKPDIKPDWYHVKLLLLQTPLQVVTWILRDVYISGTIFTMGGKEMRMEKVVCPPDPETATDQPNNNGAQTGDAKVISLADLKKK